MKPVFDLDVSVSVFLRLALRQLYDVDDQALLTRLSNAGSSIAFASLRQILKGESANINQLAEVASALGFTFTEVVAAVEPIGGEKLRALADTLAKAK